MSKQLFSSKGDSRVTTVVATPGYGPDRQIEVQYSDTKVRLPVIPFMIPITSKVEMDICSFKKEGRERSSRD